MSDVVLCLMGPTASGKTALAMHLRQDFPFEIISVDSAMVYRGMDIGTAKPTPDEQKKAPHQLINLIDPPQTYSAANFCADAFEAIATTKAKGKIPLLVGGTMMYFNALQNGLSKLPQADEQLRDQLSQKAKQMGWPATHAQLAQVDSAAAKRIHPHDAQRIQRALEVYELTGQSLTAFQVAQKRKKPYQFINFCLQPNDRAHLHAQIGQRFLKMLELGFLDEVEQLQKHWHLTPQNPSMRCVGYRQALEYFSGAYPYDAFVEKAIAATRQLAKRQLTWIRHWSDGKCIASDDGQALKTLVANIKEILDNNELEYNH